MSDNYLTILLVGFFVTVLSVPLIIKLAFRTGFLDIPRGELKIHRRPTPLLGGAAILLAVLSNLGLESFADPDLRQRALAIGVSAFILFLVGLYDDYKTISPYSRLSWQLVTVAFLIFLGNLHIEISAYHGLNLAITVLYLMVLINAMNLLDGVDGLATGVAFVAACGFFIGFLFFADALGLVLSLTLVGATAGFLIYNFAPAKIFLGDNGSTLLGLLLGVLAVIFSENAFSSNRLLVPVFILIVPFFDLGLTIFRRLKKRMPLFAGDREHFYDQLLKLGLSQRQTSLIMYGFGIVGLMAAAFMI